MHNRSNTSYADNLGRGLAWSDRIILGTVVLAVLGTAATLTAGGAYVTFFAALLGG